MTETLPLAQIKAHLSEIVDKVEGQHERVVLTRNGRPAAVLISPDDLEALEDTLELLADPQARAEIERARRYQHPRRPLGCRSLGRNRSD